MIAVLTMGTMSSVWAADSILELSLQDVLTMPEARDVLDGSVKFYLKGQVTPETVVMLKSAAVGNVKGNATEMGDRYACKQAALAALVSFHNRAKEKGANAVVDMVNYYKQVESARNTVIQCHVDHPFASVMFRGLFAKVAKGQN